jgi:hypothetical protein
MVSAFTKMGLMVSCILPVRKMRNVYKVLVGNPEAVRPLQRYTRLRKVNNIMGVKQVEYEDIFHTHLRQDRTIL